MIACFFDSSDYSGFVGLAVFSQLSDALIRNVTLRGQSLCISGLPAALRSWRSRSRFEFIQLCFPFALLICSAMHGLLPPGTS
jgi:hypothetical protein